MIRIRTDYPGGNGKTARAGGMGGVGTVMQTSGTDGAKTPEQAGGTGGTNISEQASGSDNTGPGDLGGGVDSAETTARAGGRLTVRLEQDIRDSVNWWFYWNVCARCEEEREVVFQFTNGEVLGPWGPAYSFDGMNWAWLGEDSLLGREAFVYRFTPAQPEVYFAFAIPYQLEHFDRFCGRHASNPLVKRDVLCLSEQGREVPKLVVGRSDAPRRLFFSARHHACEAAANYVLEGLLEQWIHDSTVDPDGLPAQFSIHYVPFVDIDGVENGDQGKGRAPHDHNRDYNDQPIYAATRAVMNEVLWLRPEAGFDFHCPFKWGERNDHVFFVKTGTDADRRIERFGRILQALTLESADGGGIVYDPTQDIEKGEDWNQVSPTCSSFMVASGIPMACSMEIAYFGLRDHPVTQDSLRRFGGQVARALQVYFSEGGAGK